jgi:transcriptional regulator with XRE-family HTH domain
MIKQNMSQGELERASEVSRKTIAKITKDKGVNAHPKTLHKLANGLGIEVNELLKEV